MDTGINYKKILVLLFVILLVILLVFLIWKFNPWKTKEINNTTQNIIEHKPTQKEILNKLKSGRKLSPELSEEQKKVLNKLKAPKKKKNNSLNSLKNNSGKPSLEQQLILNKLK